MLMLKDITGLKFGNLTVVSREKNNAGGTAMWLCVCDCGEKRIVEGTGLRAGRNKSCGCKSPRFKSTKFPDHPLKQTRTYKIWYGMQRRCYEAKSEKEKKLYANKGIIVCDRWIESFDNFLNDMGKAPLRHSIDRIDGNKGYSPENCRWATAKIQANNTSSNRIITAKGRTMTLSQWGEATGQKPNTILTRLRRGWSVERALQI
jgi:hypothetical protein